MTTDTRNLPTFEWVEITPDLATELLQKNETNRRLRPLRVQQYARDIQADGFTLSNDAICFDPEGNLLNGQHRLHAIVKAGTPVLHGVMHNVPPEAMKNMDSGAGRTVADVLRNQGESNSPLVASTIRQIILLDARGWTTMGTMGVNVSRQEHLDYLEDNPDIRPSVQIASNVAREVGTGPTAIALAHFIITRNVSEVAADRYIHQLVTRANEPERSAVHAVANRIAWLNRSGTKTTASEWAYLMLRGFTYWSKGAPVRRLSMPTAPTGARFPLTP